MNETLTQEQFEWMREQHDYIDLAFRWREAQTIRDLADSPYYKSVFGDMNFAEAYQVYEDMLARHTDEPIKEPQTVSEAGENLHQALIALWDAMMEDLGIASLVRWVAARLKK